MNTAMFTGNIGKEPEFRRTQSGKEVLQFSLGVYDGKDSSGAAKTLWVKCSLWGESAKRNEGKFAKGQFVAVSGMVGVDAWTNKQTGDANAAVTLIVNTIDGGPSRDNGQRQERQAEKTVQGGSHAGWDDDLPF